METPQDLMCSVRARGDQRMMPRLTDHEQELLRRVDAWSGPFDLGELDDQSLARISRSEGVDFATALLYRAIRVSADHAAFVERMEAMWDQTSPVCNQLDAAFVIAPGAFYREHPETGADGRRLCDLAASLGCRSYMIPTHSVGSAEVNGRIICDWLQRESEQNIILCSLSKGGADVKMAMADPRAPTAFRHVLAWLNVGGITAGSPMASWVVERPWLAQLYRALFWWRGHDFAFVEKLVRRPGSSLDAQPSLPPHTRVIHVLGFPLARHIRRRQTRRWHRRLSRDGPNDGATVLADSCRLPGLILPVWGADHYFETKPTREMLLGALLRYLGEERDLFQQAGPITPSPGTSVVA